MSIDELAKIGIVQWTTFGDTFDGADIFIGNGFSINLFKELSYKRLFDRFSQNCDKALTSLFTEFNTTNFEFVMDALMNTEKVERILGRDPSGISDLVKDLKQGLVKTISDTHPGYKDISPAIFRSLAYEFIRFNNIFTTNYDVFLYKIILASNNLVELGKIEAIEFQDEFYENYGTHRVAHGDDFFDCRKVYYLHGALFLYHDERGITYKFRKGGEDDEYIRMLRIEIDNGNIPLFVAEGQSNDKLTAINNNYYLRMCSQALKVERTDLVVYGFSFGRSDNHIIGWINQSKPKNVITSIYTEGKDEKELKDEMSRITNLFGNSRVEFFDSATLFKFTNYYKF